MNCSARNCHASGVLRTPWMIPRSSWLTRRRLSCPIISLSAGRYRRGFSTCTRSFGCLTNGCYRLLGNGLVGASHFFGLSTIDAGQKEAMRELAFRGGPYDTGEQEALLVYCAAGVQALIHLYEAMVNRIDLPRALLRGRYIRALAEVERRGCRSTSKALGF